MSKKAFEKIAAGLSDAIEFAEGSVDPSDFRVHVPAQVDVRAIREKLKLSQAAFAARYGFSIGRIRDWEQNRSPIDTPSRLLLIVIDKEPDAIERALRAA
jgi:putative transcriptional regulator